MVEEGGEMVVEKGEDGTSVNNCKYADKGRASHDLVCV